FWLVFLLIYLVWCVGYDKRGLLLWMAMAWVLLTICYVWMPEAGAFPNDPNRPVNINYVYNIQSDKVNQTWMDPNWYFALYMLILMAGVYPATHLLLWSYM